MIKQKNNGKIDIKLDEKTKNKIKNQFFSSRFFVKYKKEINRKNLSLKNRERVEK